MRNIFEAKLTNKLAAASLLCCLLSTTACVSNKSYFQKECEDGICTSNREYTAICTENAAGYSECIEQPEVNYTETAAQYRQYGERTPRDHRITQAGAGNNISAAIQPSIDDEVVYYENTAQAINAQQMAAYNQNGQPINYAPNGQPTAYAPNGQPVTYAPNGQPTAYAPNGQPVANGQVAARTPYSYDPNAYGAPNTQPQNQGDDSDMVKDWMAEEGQSLKDLLTQWSDEAGWRLIWKTNRNYTLNAGAMFRGSFADVTSALVRAFARARPAPIATFYKGNRVLVVETMEDENAYD